MAKHNRYYTVIISDIYYSSFNEALADEDNIIDIIFLNYVDYEGETVTLEKGNYIYINHSALEETLAYGDIYIELSE